MTTAFTRITKAGLKSRHHNEFYSYWGHTDAFFTAVGGFTLLPKGRELQDEGHRNVLSPLLLADGQSDHIFQRQLLQAHLRQSLLFHRLI